MVDPFSCTIVFAGTPEFAVPALTALLDAGYPVCAVFTQPNRPAGRGRKLQAPPVKHLAEARGVPVFQPKSLRSSAEIARVQSLNADIIIVAAYGLILPAAVLAAPRHGCINIHASLLPRWRGAAPIQRALLAGDPETGITLMQVDEGLDTGDILATARCPIDAEETASELDARLARLGAGLLLARLPAILAGSLTPRAQEETQATYARKLTKTEAALDWTRPAADLQRRVLAFNPWPVAQTSLDGKLLRLWRARALDEPARRPPGSVLRAGKGGIDVATGGGVLRLLEVQAAGRRVMRAADFANAHRLEGKVLGE